MYKYIHMDIHIPMHMHMHIRMHTYMYACMHTYFYTYPTLSTSPSKPCTWTLPRMLIRPDTIIREGVQDPLTRPALLPT